MSLFKHEDTEQAVVLKMQRDPEDDETIVDLLAETLQNLLEPKPLIIDLGKRKVSTEIAANVMEWLRENDRIEECVPKVAIVTENRMFFMLTKVALSTQQMPMPVAVFDSMKGAKKWVAE